MAVVDTSSPLGALVHERRDQILEVAARHRARTVRVFGSVARGDAGEGSDIDFLVDFEDGSSLFDLLHLTEDLRELLGHPVDVVSVGGLKERDERIVAEAVEL
ncbi:MAG: nucleotidyltransferase domain-containing protein [Acidimicrobiales bacterium]|nr:nucleotidyltransferase domain-containing protein [Acidimicrobiales bacterium]